MRKPDPRSPEEDEKEKKAHMKTKMLDITVFKIATLLQRGFGTLVAQNIADNVASNDNLIDPMQPGIKNYYFFTYVQINYFDIVECLQDEIIVFINKIIGIVHGTSEYWKGGANKNAGNLYLLSWKIDDNFEEIIMKIF